MNQNKKSIAKPILLSALAIVYTLLVRFVDVRAIGPAGTSVGFAGINGFVRDIFPYNKTFYLISKDLSYLFYLLIAGFAAYGLIMLIKYKSFAKVDKKLYVLAGLYAFALSVYLFFEKVIINYRPIMFKEAPEASYPSSHTMVMICVFGSAIIMFRYYLKNRKLCTAVNAALVIICAVIVVTRLMSGVHWLTDIVGGIIIAAAILSIFSYLIKWVKGK